MDECVLFQFMYVLKQTYKVESMKNDKVDEHYLVTEINVLVTGNTKISLESMN